ncbi:hypothetical protein [Methylopila sp. M107]|uniref:hypothetical protein n=1 Tax=Methylopila sp. M107 TaxID=1101190 RepID=UPI0003760CA1|nr:hypothetical protein [Methylopila sp. M107]
MHGSATTLELESHVRRDARPAGALDVDRADLALALFWSAAAILISAVAFQALGSSFDTMAGMNVWFQGDTPRVMENMTDPASNHYRTAVHPISSILTTPLVLAIAKLGLSAATAAKTLIALAGAANAALMFFTLRHLRLPRLAACVFVALFLSSAAYLHWHACVELGPFGSLTITAALYALVRGRALGVFWWVLISAASLGVTVTNWSAGLAATILRWPLARTILISTFALVTVVVLATVQGETFRNTGFFLNYKFAEKEIQWTQIAMEREGKASWSPAQNLYAMYVTTIVAPRPQLKTVGDMTLVTNQTPALGELSPIGKAAIAAWLALLGCGIYAAFRERSVRTVAIGVGLMLLAQTALHSIYGDVTFLYAPHFLPMLVVLAALSWFTPARRLALGLALVVVVLGAVNNAWQFSTAADLMESVVASGAKAP